MAVQVRKLFTSLMLFVLGLSAYMVYVIHLSTGSIGSTATSKHHNVALNYSIGEGSNVSKGTDYIETIYVSDLIRKRGDLIAAGLVTAPPATSVQQHDGKPSVPQTKPSPLRIRTVQLPTQSRVNAPFSHNIHTSWQTVQKQLTSPILRDHSERKSVAPINSVPGSQQSVHTVSSHDTSRISSYSITAHSPSPASSSKAADSSGYVLAVGIYEQQTIACKNLFQLQCWAASLGMSVVKPVMKDSFLKTPLSDDAQRQSLRFEDLFDLADWNREAKQRRYSALVSWSDFLSKAPRKVIIVCFTYPSVSLLKLRVKAGEAAVHAAQGERYKSGCKTQWPTEHELQYLQSKGFVVVRTVCLNFYYGDKLSSEVFNAHIFGEFSPSEVTVAMEMWRGIGSGQRVLIHHSCEIVPLINERIAPSDRQVRDAKAYVKEHLNGEPYLAIIGRLEMSMLTVRSSSPVIPYCLEATHKKWDQLKRELGLQRTFLSIDIGRYGSKRFRYHLDPTLKSEFVHFFQSIYGPSATVRDWERTFENVSGLTDPGYVGLLQKVIVTRAKCVLFVGGGAFQRHALHLYQMGHPSPAEQCVHVVKECTSASKLHLP